MFSAELKACALQLGTKLLLTNDYWALGDIREEDLRNAKRTLGESLGADALDAALCAAGIFSRTPLRGIVRSRLPKPGPSIENYVGLYRVPEQFREITLLYVRQYNARVSARYSTVRAKIAGAGSLLDFIDEVYPHLRSSADIRPEHAQAFIPHREAQAQASAKRGL